jgi:hypothetical protein
LVGEDLSGVTFVRDYVQLQFNPPPILNVYTPISVRIGARRTRSGEEFFANMLIGQINKYVQSVELRSDEALDINFDDNSQISISLRSQDYRGPEAVTLFRRDQSIVVT